MGRAKARKSDQDRYLALQPGGAFHYKRRVPVIIAHLDQRAPHVRVSLKTDDIALARRKRDLMEAADDALWASMITDGVTDPARRRYESAVRHVEALGFTFHSSAHLEMAVSIEELDRRLAELESRPNVQRTHLAVVGAVDVPKASLSDAFDIYCDEIVADELVGKSQAQKDQWKKVKKRAVSNFKAIVADKAMDDITVDDARKVYLYWLARIAPKTGRPTASASSGNRDVGNLRVLYGAYFRHMGQQHRVNPFDGFGFSMKKKRSRPSIPADWIRERLLLAPKALAGLNDEARGILLIMIESGARPSEIANLQPSSFRLSHNVPHMAIEPREDPDNPREIKTESSRRLVPLVGVALAAAQRHHATGFPRYHDRENDLSATLNKFLRTNGLLPTRGHTVYSFRHAFEDRMKIAGLEDELRRLIMGHAIDRPKYGEGGSLAWRRDELMKVVLPFDPTIV